ncbi:Peroxiredoxin [Halobacillus alkaliphilus]|uniref:Peroxiredoxin n=1 Tax=Halobacillus alkaliphilus TaxID=396056 RepID=A0A1I2QEY3_9BACI|nr:redoxin domain-containing protein [Halobacillus alkaliphilus]SFG24817.1 Peroxiredoxin [Halobacillus alkaliphilus]
MSPLNLNEQVPDFTLPGVSGKNFSFKGFLNENGEDWHLLIYFRGSWCPACVEELKELEESRDYFDKHQVRLTTISADHRDSLKNMVKKHDLTFPVLADQELDFLEKYGIHYHDENSPYEDHGTHGEPAYFLTDEDGRLLYQQRQTSPFGRPHPKELRKIIQYIRKNLK